AAVTLLALANADPVAYRPHIEGITQYLISYQGSDGEWDYRERTDTRQGDTSISQYAVLGLWEAARSGVRVPKSVWDKAARWHITRQQRDGGFAYHPVGVGATVGQYIGQTIHTMSVAGTSSLMIARMHLFGDGANQVQAEEVVPGARKSNRKKFGFLTPSTGAADEAEAETVRVEVKRLAVPDGPVTVKLSG